MGILKSCQGVFNFNAEQILKCPGSTELLDFILHIPHSFLTPDILFKTTLKISLGTDKVANLRAEIARKTK